MGMYTELFISTRIKDDPVAVKAIQAMLGDELADDLPSHPLFQTPRWRSMLVCSSHYFVPKSTHSFTYDSIAKCWILISRSDFKNYDDEIKLFVDWLETYLDASYGEMIGYYRYEESSEPTILYCGGKPNPYVD